MRFSCAQVQLFLSFFFTSNMKFPAFQVALGNFRMTGTVKFMIQQETWSILGVLTFYSHSVMEVISSTIQYVTITPKNFLRNAYYPVSYTLLVLFEVDVIVLADLETNLKAQSWLVACSERVVGGQRHAPCFLHGIHSIVLVLLWILLAFS